MHQTTWQSLGLEHLPMTEKLHVVENLLDDLDAELNRQPVPDTHLQELRFRVQESKLQPDEGFSWDEVKTEIEKEL